MKRDPRPSDGILLAFDTSGPIGSVVVSSGWEVLARGTLGRDPGHASGLIPMVERVLAEAGSARRELTGIAVGEGPGSFTGVRVAAATAKGLRRALGVPLWALSSLAAAAMTVDEGAVRYALFDARADRVYGACFGIDDTGVRTIVEEHGGELRDVLESAVPEGAAFVGDAAEKHRTRIESAGHEVVSPVQGVTLADGLVRFLGLNPEFGPVSDPTAWEPSYVRASSAERLWKA